MTAVGAPESASEAVLGACLTNRLADDCAVNKHRLVVEQAAALDLSWPPCTRSLGVSSTMAVVRVRAAIRLDGRRAHELRLLAATAQANGGCDAVLSSGVRWHGPTIRTWSPVVPGASTLGGIQYCHLYQRGEPECRCKPRPSKQRR